MTATTRVQAFVIKYAMAERAEKKSDLARSIYLELLRDPDMKGLPTGELLGRAVDKATEVEGEIDAHFGKGARFGTRAMLPQLTGVTRDEAQAMEFVLDAMEEHGVEVVANRHAELLGQLLTPQNITPKPLPDAKATQQRHDQLLQDQQALDERRKEPSPDEGGETPPDPEPTGSDGGEGDKP